MPKSQYTITAKDCPRATLALKGIRPQFFKHLFPLSNLQSPSSQRQASTPLASTSLASTSLSHLNRINYECKFV